MKRIDYHVHTRFSDGYLSPQEMIFAARDKNLHELCITDHYSTLKPALSKFDLDGYFKEIDELRMDKSIGIEVFIGIEVDMYSIDPFDKLEEYNWDLILFEYVFNSPDWLSNFRKIIDFKRKHPEFNVGLAHTRFSRVSESKLDYILNLLKEQRIIIELNTSYKNYMDSWFNYLNEDFWFSIGTDAHGKERLGDINPALYYLKTRQIPTTQIISLKKN